MSKLSYTVEENNGGYFGLKISFENGELYRYFASITTNKALLENFVASLEASDISYLHIDDVMCDFICESLVY